MCQQSFLLELLYKCKCCNFVSHGISFCGSKGRNTAELQIQPGATEELAPAPEEAGASRVQNFLLVAVRGIGIGGRLNPGGTSMRFMNH